VAPCYRPEVADPERFVEAWRQRWARDAAQLRQREAAARAVAVSLADVLRRKYGVGRVLLVGSLARGDFRSSSDIDLAVEGLAPGELFPAGAELERLAQGFEVDLVPIESADAAFLEAARREGIELP
jgi:uncharacterized protein